MPTMGADRSANVLNALAAEGSVGNLFQRLSWRPNQET